MQNVSFKDVDEFLDYLPEDELKTVTVLRKLVIDSIPHVREKLSYNVPFYHRHAAVCFIWPGSITWGGKGRKGVRLGFSQAHLFDDSGFLEKGNRKQVYWKDFFHVSEIDHTLVKSCLFEALRIDDTKASR